MFELPAGGRDADHVVDGNRDDDDDDDDDHCDAMLPIKTGPLIRGRLTSQAVQSVPFLWVNEDLPLYFFSTIAGPKFGFLDKLHKPGVLPFKFDLHIKKPHRPRLLINAYAAFQSFRSPCRPMVPTVAIFRVGPERLPRSPRSVPVPARAFRVLRALA